MASSTTASPATDVVADAPGADRDAASAPASASANEAPGEERLRSSAGTAARAVPGLLDPAGYVGDVILVLPAPSYDIGAASWSSTLSRRQGLARRGQAFEQQVHDLEPLPVLLPARRTTWPRRRRHVGLHTLDGPRLEPGEAPR